MLSLTWSTGRRSRAFIISASAIDPDSLALLVLFSSSSARFGRAGQVAYAAANEYLNKWAQQQALRLPSCRVVSFNWGPWAGGMVTDALKPMFEQEGLSLIPLDAGAKLVVEEARRGEGPAVELVVVAEPRAAIAPASRDTRRGCSRPPIAKRSRRSSAGRSIWNRSRFLSAHVIDGHPVLPVALILEWMAEAALHRNPGLLVCGVDDFRLFKGVILGHQKPATVELRAGKPVRRGCSIRGAGRALRHACQRQRGRSCAGRDRPGRSPRGVQSAACASRSCLRTRSCATRSIRPCSSTARSCKASSRSRAAASAGSQDGCRPRPATSDWIDRPLRSKWLIDPLAIDSAFQLVGLVDPGDRWVPIHFPPDLGSLRLFQRDFPEQGARVMVEIEQSSPARATAAIEILDEERPADRPAGQFRVRHRRVAQPGVSAQPALLPILRRLELSDAGRFIRATGKSDRHRGHRRALSRQRDARRILG